MGPIGRMELEAGSWTLEGDIPDGAMRATMTNRSRLPHFQRPTSNFQLPTSTLPQPSFTSCTSRLIVRSLATRTPPASSAWFQVRP
jgi:hypothetical protein